MHAAGHTKSLPSASRSLDAALMRTLNRKLSKSSDGSDAGDKLQDKEPSGGSSTTADKMAGAADKLGSSAKPPTGKGEGDLEEIREKFRIVKVGRSVGSWQKEWFVS